MNNKKIFSFIGIGVVALAAMFVFGVSNAQAADSIVRGNLPNTFEDGVNVYAYSAVQATPCDGIVGVGDAGVAYGSALWATIVLDATYANTDTDYSITVAEGVIGANLYVYFCNNSNNIIDIYNVGDFAADQIRNASLGKISNGISSAHIDLDDYRIAICTAVGGTQYNNVTKQINAATNQYSQYYAFQQAADTGGATTPPATITALFDSDSDDCTNDTTKRTGYVINVGYAGDNYGIVVAYNPDTKVTGDMLAVAALNNAVFTIYDDAATEDVSDDTSAGMGFEINAGDPDGGAGNDDFIVYYDIGKITNDIHVQIATTSNGISHWLGIDETLFNDTAPAGAGAYDISVDLNDAGVGVPSDINSIQTIDTCNVNDAGAPNDAAIFKTLALHNTYLYDIYMPDCSNSETVYFKKASSTVFSKAGVDLTASAAIDVRKITGEAHDQLENAGTADNIEIWAGNACSANQRDTDAVLVQPVGVAGADYEVYFEDLTEDVYIQADKDGTYKTCGMKVLTGDFGADQTATVDLNIMVNGTVAAGIDVAAVDKDAGESDASDADVCEAFTNVAANLYYLFASTNGEADYVDATSNVFFVATGALSTELLKTGKNLTTDKQVDAGRVIGDTHADFQTAAGGADDVQVYSDAAASTIVSSEPVQPVAGVGANDDFTQYYEATGGDTNYYFWGQANFDPDAGGGCAAETYETIAVFAGGGGQSDILDVTNKVEGLVYGTDDGGASDIASVAVDIDNAGGWDYYTKEVNHCATDKDYKVYVADAAAAATEDSIVFYTGTNPASWTELLDTKDLSGTYVANTFVDLSGDEVMGASRISGAADASFRAAGAGSEAIEVYDTYAVPAAVTNRLNSTSVVTDGADSYYLFIIQDNDANIGANTLDLKIIDQNNYASYIFDDIFPTAAAAAITSGSDTDYDLTEKITGDTPVGTDVIYIDDSNAPGTYYATGIPDAVSGVYAIYIDATKLAAAVGTFEFEVQEPAATQVLLRDSDVGAVAPLADETFNVAKVSGDVALAATSIGVYGNADCATGGALNSLDAAPGAAYDRYFEAAGGSYYVKVGDGVYSTCRTTALALTDQVAAPDADFDQTVDGQVPATGVTNTDVNSVAIDTGTYTYWSDTVGVGPTNYVAYIDGSISTAAAFTDTGGGIGTTLLTVTKDDTADRTIDVSAANGATHLNLDTINAVCETYRTLNTSCANKYSTVSAAGAGAAYEIFFEEQGGAGDYYLETLDTDTGVDYYAWDPFTTSGTAGSYITVDLGGKLSGRVREEYDSTLGIPLALVGMYTDTLAWPANEVARAYSYGAAGEQASPAGNYRMYGPAGTYDAQASKAGYITNVKTDFGALDVAWNWDMASGIEVTVQDGGGNPITYATVEIYSCDGSPDPAACTALATTCVNTPTTDCTRTGDNSNGNGANGYYDFAGIASGTYIQIRVTDPSVPPIFEAVYSPDASETVNAFVTSNTTAITQTVNLYNHTPSCTLTAQGQAGTYERSGMVYAALGQDIIFRMDCGETGLTVGADVSALIGGGGVTPFTEDPPTSGSYITTTTIAAGATTGEKTITVTASDGVNQTTQGIRVTVDKDAPATALTVNGSGTPDTDGSVEWSWNAATDNAGGSGLRFYNVKIAANDDDCSGGVFFEANMDTLYLPYAILPTGATYYACVTAVDYVGNAGTQYNSTGILVDTTVPTDLFITIDGGKQYTTAAATTITVAANGATQMQFSCDGDNWTVAEDYDTSRAFDLRTEGGAGCTDADGAKTVYVKMLDAAGNSATASDEVILDTAAPDASGVTVTAVADATYHGRIAVSWDDPVETGSGVATYTLYSAVDGGAAAVIASGLTAKEFEDAVYNDGSYTYAITATDKAGLTSGASPDSAAADVDVTGPAPVSLTINSDALYTGDPAATLTFTAIGADTVAFSCDAATWSAEVPYVGPDTAAFDLTTGEGCVGGTGLKTVYIRATDVAGNATYTFDFITLGTAPTVIAQDPDDGDEIDPWDTIAITFSEAMDLATINSTTIQIRDYDTDIPLTGTFITQDTAPGAPANTFIIDPWSMYYSGHYYISVSSVKSAVGIPIAADYPVNKDDHDFTTSAYVATPPTVESFEPGAGQEVGINIGSFGNIIAVTFDTLMEWESLTTNNVQLWEVGTPDTQVTLFGIGILTGADKTIANLIPNANLTYGADYYIKVISGGINPVQDLHGDLLAADYTSANFSAIPQPVGALGMWATTTPNKYYALNDGYWPNENGAGTGGWAWTMHITVPTTQLNVSMKFDNWTGVGGASIPAATYIRYYSDEAVVGSGDPTTKRTITAANLYGTAMVVNPATDLNPNMDGIQIDIHIETKVPTTSTAGGYSTQYSIQSLP